MESDDAGVLAASPPNLDLHSRSRSPPPPAAVTTDAVEMTVPDLHVPATKAQTPPPPPPPPAQSRSPPIAKHTPRVTEHMSLPDTPTRVTDHSTLSNLRDTTNGPAKVHVTPLPADNGLKSADLDIFSHDGPLFDPQLPVPEPTEGSQCEAIKLEQDSSGHDTLNHSSDWTGQNVGASDDLLGVGNAVSDDDDDEHEGYAMLRFSNSYCVITSLNLIIQRDAKYLAAYKAERKKAKEEAKARASLAAYQQEPSQPSQPGDDDEVGEDLKGRPALGALSSFSEQGGPVAFIVDEQLSSTSRRRRRKKGNSSSANSIAPRDLYTLPEDDILNTEPVDNRPDSHEWAALPVHPALPEDITKISREHLIFTYNYWHDERWILRVVGNGAVVNEVYHPKGSEVALQHDDEIWISTLKFDFQLPRTEEEENEDNLDDVEAGTSPATSRTRRASSIADAEESEEDKRPKVKLKLKRPKKSTEQEPEPAKAKSAVKGKGKHKGEKPAGKAKGKDARNGEEVAGSPEVSKKPERGKKPKAAAPEAGTEAAKEPKAKPEQASPPVVLINLEPGSVLADLAPEQMPEKRKGPGRPPKNGLLSKRDESGVKRKRREYERRNEPIPDLNTLLAEVRHEQRQRDLQAKAAARGEQPPDLPLPSIESSARPTIEGGAQMPPRDSQGQESQTPLPTDAMLAFAQVRPRQRSPSPIKPEAEFTEEDLKKPSMTYIYIIDEILSSIEGGQADLQTIYDKIQKRWPYYKYRVGSIGWQSSVRHNLLSCERFVDAGKSGKGKFWRINFDHPLDNKKRKSPPPPNRPMQSGQMQPPYGQPGYAGNYGQPNGNGQQQYNGQGNYYSPYPGGPNGQPPPGQAPNGQYGGHQGGAPPHHQNAGNPHPPPPPAETPLTRQVNAIMNFRSHWLAGHAIGSEEYKLREDGFVRAVGYYSYVTSNGQGDPVDLRPGEDKLEPFPSMKAIFDRFLSDQANAAETAPDTGAGAPANQQQQPAQSGQQHSQDPAYQSQQPQGPRLQDQQAQAPPPQGQQVQGPAPQGQHIQGQQTHRVQVQQPLGQQPQPNGQQQLVAQQQQPMDQHQGPVQPPQQLSTQQQSAPRPAMAQGGPSSVGIAQPPQAAPGGNAPPNGMPPPSRGPQAAIGAAPTALPSVPGPNGSIEAGQRTPQDVQPAANGPNAHTAAAAAHQTPTVDEPRSPAPLQETKQASMASMSPNSGPTPASAPAPALQQGKSDSASTPQFPTASVIPVQSNTSTIANPLTGNASTAPPATANGVSISPVPGLPPAVTKTDSAAMSPPALGKQECQSTATSSAEPMVLDLDAQEPRPQSAGVKRAAEADEEKEDDVKRQKTS